jgi:hypothetical protein
MLEALGPVRSMFEFLVRQRWLATDPDRNWKVWMERDLADRERWRKELHKRAPALHDTAAAVLTPAQRQERDMIGAARKRLARELGDRLPEDRWRLKQRADQVGLGFIYDVVYQYESSAAIHPTMLAVDLFSETRQGGLRLRGEPAAHFAPVAVYLQGALLLHEALSEAAEHTRSVDFPELPALGNDLRALSERRTSARLPNWPQLLPSKAFDQV